MENINFKVTERSVREYLSRHQKDSKIKNKEAMFVKYMKESKEIITQETLEILMERYNNDDKCIDGVYCIGQYAHVFSELPSFTSYLKGIKNLDISGICHILIPALGYYGFYKGDYYPVIASHIELASIVENVLGEPMEWDYQQLLNSAIDDYCVTRKIDFIRTSNYTVNMMIKMEKEVCRRELVEYSHIYGEEPVKQIRKMIRERV